jgi:hypothetical protein
LSAGRRAAGERGRQTRQEVVAVARLDQLDVDLGLFLLERLDQRAVGVDLRRIAEDEEADPPRGRRFLVVATAAGDGDAAQEGDAEKRGKT